MNRKSEPLGWTGLIFVLVVAAVLLFMDSRLDWRGKPCPWPDGDHRNSAGCILRDGTIYHR